jgi:hypothetical protein
MGLDLWPVTVMLPVCLLVALLGLGEFVAGTVRRPTFIARLGLVGPHFAWGRAVADPVTTLAPPRDLERAMVL